MSEDLSAHGISEAQLALQHRLRLEATFEAMADAVMVFDALGQLVFYNTAAHSLLALERFPAIQTLSLSEWAQYLHVRDEYGQELSAEQLPLTRVLQGEMLKSEHSADVWVTVFSGCHLLINISGAPIYTVQGELDGAVLVLRDVTARREQEHRTTRALHVLVAMAEAMVQFPESLRQPANEPAVYFRHAAARLLDLACKLLECSTGAILALRSDNKLEAIALVGLSPEEREHFWSQTTPVCLEAFFSAARREFSLHGDTALVDLAAVPGVYLPAYGIRQVLAAPIWIGEQLIGVLELDYGSMPHTFPLEQESMLIGAIARLAALVIERERLSRERILAQASELALRESNRRMDEFLSMTSHELRNPLTTIKGSIQMVRRLFHRRAHELPLPTLLERAEDMLERAERQVEVEVRLVNDLLDVSRIQSNKLELYMQPLNLLELVREVMTDFQTSEEHRRFVLSLPEDALPMVHGDANRLSQVLINFLSNAVRYSPEEYPIAVRLELSATAARVSVRDEGPGLTSEEQRHIWERFYQGTTRSHAAGSSGLGLGLYISQTIIQQHHGYVGVESKPGRGSTFWFSLPLLPTNTQPIDAISHAH
ncbi:MAG TPA: ATP-binding protein [Ktedonobacteraceae bacterium]|nr:ATP-binding protein [Ktedonobacteraceae bacterium]